MLAVIGLNYLIPVLVLLFCGLRLFYRYYITHKTSLKNSMHSCFFFLLKSQDKVETLEPEALVMFISRTYFFLTAEIILIYVILEITFWSGSSDFNWYLYIHVYWDSLSMQMFLTFISFSFRFYFSISSMLYDIQVLIVQLSYICTPWAIYEPVVHHLSSETQ